MKNALTLLTYKKSIGCELYLSGGLAKSRFDVLEEYLESIDAAFGAELDWQRLPDRIACRIKATLHDADWQDPSDHDRQMDWLASSVRRLTAAITPHLQELREVSEPDDVE